MRRKPKRSTAPRASLDLLKGKTGAIVPYSSSKALKNPSISKLRPMIRLREQTKTKAEGRLKRTGTQKVYVTR
jgi:hypothetical protein